MEFGPFKRTNEERQAYPEKYRAYFPEQHFADLERFGITPEDKEDERSMISRILHVGIEHRLLIIGLAIGIAIGASFSSRSSSKKKISTGFSAVPQPSQSPVHRQDSSTARNRTNHLPPLTDSEIDEVLDTAKTVLESEELVDSNPDASPDTPETRSINEKTAVISPKNDLNREEAAKIILKASDLIKDAPLVTDGAARNATESPSSRPSKIEFRDLDFRFDPNRGTLDPGDFKDLKLLEEDKKTEAPKHTKHSSANQLNRAEALVILEALAGTNKDKVR